MVKAESARKIKIYKARKFTLGFKHEIFENEVKRFLFVQGTEFLVFNKV